MNPPATHGDEAPDDRTPVLIVGLDRSLHRRLSSHFRRDYRVASAYGGDEGLAMAEALVPDLIVVDLTTPSLDGSGWMRALRSKPTLDSVPVVALAAQQNRQEVVALLEHGLQDVIDERCAMPELTARVRNLIGSKRARDLLNELVDQPETDLVRLAEAVAHQQRELRSAIAQAQALRSHAENANRIKSGFLRLMSHELKTPLTAMQLQLELLERDPRLGAMPRVREGHARIRRSSRRLLHLIDTMLEWARVESGRVRLYPERFDLVSAVEDTVRELSSQAQQKHLEMELHVSDDLQRELVSDRRLLNLVLINLVGRAIQLTPTGKVELRLDQHGAVRRIAIKDGSPQRVTDDPAPFEPMQPGGAVSGVALYVVRDIARAVGAEITVEHTPGQGHVLTLALPSLDVSVAAQPIAALNGMAGTHHPHP